MGRTPRTSTDPTPDRRMRGFESAFGLMKDPVRKAGESRGFAVARLVTHWAEVVGDDLAAITTPVKVGYGREGFGATLTLLVRGSHAPMVDMQKEAIRAKVNGVYGYNAIARITITQTAPTGFAEGQAAFGGPPKRAAEPDPETVAKARDTAAPIADDGLRSALETLARNILHRQKQNKG